MLTSLTNSRWWSSGRRRRIALVGVVTAGMLGASAIYATAANAAVPTFPDNIIIFPERDFISIDGYDAHKGEVATVEVYRDGVGVVGSATGRLAGGSPSLEINHPGGVCWGAGTGLGVTPDILPGDKVTVKVGGQALGDATAQDATVADTPAGPSSELTGTTLIVHGHLGPNVIPTQFEQRIVNRDLTATDVGRRDVRAATPTFERAAKGGYESKLEVADDTFTATYHFDTAATAEVAANGLKIAMTWQVQDLDGNQQGLTTSEFGELGGPGMGGCPNGPLKTGPAAPSNVTAVRSGDGTSIKLTWTPATTVPGTPAVTGYRVTAVADTTSGAGEQVEIGKRLGNPAATGTTITGLATSESYTVELRSVSGAGETFPVKSVRPLNPGEDMTPPTVAATPAGGTFSVPQTVTLTANESGSEIYYSLTGASLTSGDLLSNDPSITRYTGPFMVAQTAKLTYVAFDPSGNVSPQGEQRFTITNDPVPAAPSFTGTPVVGTGSVTLNWEAPAPGAPGLTIDGYSVQVYNADGTAAGAARTTAGDVTSLVVDGLTGDTPYLFTVRAKNINGYGPESAKFGPVTPKGALAANAGPDQSGIIRGTNVGLDAGGSTQNGVTYSWEQVLTGPNDPNKVILNGATTLTPSFTYPLFQYPMTNNPLTFKLTVSDGTTTRADEVMVSTQPDTVTIASGRYRPRSELRLDGSGTRAGATITIHAGSMDGPVLGRAPVVAAPPAPGGTWTLRLRNGQVPPTNQPIWIESDQGGTAGPFTPAL
jgi:hypothetical protein